MNIYTSHDTVRKKLPRKYQLYNINTKDTMIIKNEKKRKRKVRNEKVTWDMLVTGIFLMVGNHAD